MDATGRYKTKTCINSIFYTGFWTLSGQRESRTQGDQTVRVDLTGYKRNRRT